MAEDKMKPVCRFKPQSASKPAEIFLYGRVGKDMWGDGISSEDFAKQFRALGKFDNLDLRIDSEGGAVTDARAIYALLVQHKSKVCAYIDGLAASAASLVAMAGNRICIGEGSFLMIHQARAYAGGTAEELRKWADTLDQINETMVATYAGRSGADPDQVRKWMADETWFSGKQAVDAGFADEIMPDLKAVAYSPRLEAFKNVPERIRRFSPLRAKALKLIKEIRR